MNVAIVSAIRSHTIRISLSKDNAFILIFLDSHRRQNRGQNKLFPLVTNKEMLNFCAQHIEKNKSRWSNIW